MKKYEWTWDNNKQSSKKEKVSKQAAQKFDVERLNNKKLSEMEIRKGYHIKISESFAAWRISMIARTYREFGKTLRRISKYQLQCGSVWTEVT